MTRLIELNENTFLIVRKLTYIFNKMHHFCDSSPINKEKHLQYAEYFFFNFQGTFN